MFLLRELKWNHVKWFFNRSATELKSKRSAEPCLVAQTEAQTVTSLCRPKCSHPGGLTAAANTLRTDWQGLNRCSRWSGGIMPASTTWQQKTKKTKQILNITSSTMLDVLLNVKLWDIPAVSLTRETIQTCGLWCCIQKKSYWRLFSSINRSEPDSFQFCLERAKQLKCSVGWEMFRLGRGICILCVSCLL